MSIYDVFSGGNKPYDKEQWAAQKQAERKEAYELIDAVTPLPTPVWYPPRCPKRRSLKITASGNRAVSM